MKHICCFKYLQINTIHCETLYMSQIILPIAYLLRSKSKIYALKIYE